MNLEKNLAKILIIDYGSQFTQLIARRIRELGVYSKIISHNKIKLKDILSDNGENIGLATIYRVLTQLEMADLIQKNNFDNQSAYEIKKSHHDHLICTICGNIIEFVNDDLEKLQEHISKKYNFTLESHVMTLFGNCNKPNCKGRKEKSGL